MEQSEYKERWRWAVACGLHNDKFEYVQEKNLSAAKSMHG